MTSEEQLMWGSHLPVLAACVTMTTGDVLELGIGHFSTPFLHTLCAALRRQLVSVEADANWLEKMPLGRSQHHRMLVGDYDVIVPELANRRWSVTLIDNSPGGPRRSKDFKTLLPVSEFVVVHDYHRDNEEAIAPLLSGKYYAVSKLYEPPTLVVTKNPSVDLGWVLGWVE